MVAMQNVAPLALRAAVSERHVWVRFDWREAVMGAADANGMRVTIRTEPRMAAYTMSTS